MAPSTDRRRKLLREDSRSDSSGRAPLAAIGSSKRRGRAYSPEARADNQPRVSDLIPLRSYTLWLCFLGGCVAWALVNALALAHDEWWHDVPAARGLAFGGGGTLGKWLASVTLLASGINAAFVYHFRRHKLDDYRGRYRLWLVAAVVLFAASVDVGTQLVAAGVTWIASVSSSIQGIDPHLRSIAPWFLIGILILARVWGEVWACRLASVCVVFALASYAAAAMCFVGTWDLPSGVMEKMAITALTQWGHLLTWMSLLLYLKRVYLHAQNALPVKSAAKKVARKPAEEPDESSDEEVPESRIANAPSPRRQEREAVASDEDGGGLSRADRKRMKKEQRHRRAA